MSKRTNLEGSFGKQTIGGIDYFYYVFPTDALGKRKKIYGRTQKELKEKIAKYKEEKVKTVSSLNKRITIANLCYDYLHTSCYVGKRTLDHYYGIVKNRIDLWTEYDLGNVVAYTVTPSMVTDFLFSFKERYAKRSIDRTYAVLEQAIKYGIEQKIIPSFDFTKVVKPSEKDVLIKRKSVEILEQSDLNDIANECIRKTADGKDYYGVGSKIIYMIIFTGCRVAEMCSLKWKNVAEDLSFIDITELYGRVQDRDENGVPLGTSHFEISPPKTATSNRRIPLPKKAQETIAKRREYVLKRAGYADMPLNKALNLLADEFVFTTRNNRFVERNSVEKTCRHIVDNCGLSSSITPHTLRHAYGSILIAKGVDIKIVSKLLGHTSVSFTYDVYINVLKSEEIKAVNKLDEIIEHEEIDTILTGRPEDIPTEYLS